MNNKFGQNHSLQNIPGQSWGINPTGRIMRHTPWPIDEDGCYRSPDTQQEKSEQYVISGEAVVETIEHFIEHNGDLSKLSVLLNEHIIAPAYKIEPDFLLAVDHWYTNEYYFYIILFIKLLIKDYSFCYSNGQQLLSKYHPIYEKGYFEYQAWGKDEQGNPVKDQSSENFSSLLQYVDEHYNKELIDEFYYFLNIVLKKQNKSIDETYLKNTHFWHSAEFIAFSYSLISVLTNDQMLFYKLSLQGPSRIIKIIGKAMSHPEAIYRNIPALGKRFSTTTSYKIIELSETHCRLRYYPTKGIDYKIGCYALNLNWYVELIHLGIFCGIPSYIFTLQPAEYQIKKSLLEGSEYFEAIFKWERYYPLISLNKMILYTLLFIACNLLFFFFIPGSFALFGSATILISYLCLFIRHIIKYYRKRIADFQEQYTLFCIEKDEFSQDLQIEKDSLEIKISERTRELAAVNEKLKSLDRAKTNFFSNISHELRTPLTMILSPIESIVQGDYQKTIDLDFFKRIYNNGERLLCLINNLLDFNRIEAKAIVLNKERTDILKLIELFISNSRSAAYAKRIELTFHSNWTGKVNNNERFFAHIDRDLFEKAVYNLISNALKFTQKRGCIIVWLHANEDMFSVSVKDDGIGIPLQWHTAIFERFIQVDSAKNREFDGSGIGLSLVKEITEMHNGRIELVSTEGKGSTFTLHYPTSMVELMPNREPSSTPVMMKQKWLFSPAENNFENRENAQSNKIPKPSSDTPIALIVDDNREIVHYIKETIENSYDTMCAYNGTEALHLLTQGDITPDIIITDLMMPHLDGQQLVRLIRANPEYRYTPIIILTAKSGIETKLLSFKGGINDYILKPFNAQELIARMNAQIEMKKLRDNLTLSNSKLLDQLKNRAEKSAVIITNDNVEKIAIVSQFLTENYNLDVSHKKLADSIHMSTDQLYTIFNKITGMSIQTYINRLRVDTALRLLETSTKTVSSIAYETGFDSVRSLNHQLIKITGKNMTDIKRMIKEH